MAYDNVFALAPHNNKISSPNIYKTIMITIELNTKELKQFEIILFAWSFSSAPRLIEANGAPPRPNKLVKAVIIVIIALHKPIPAIAKAPSSILPI